MKNEDEDEIEEDEDEDGNQKKQEELPENAVLNNNVNCHIFVVLFFLFLNYVLHVAAKYMVCKSA